MDRLAPILIADAERKTRQLASKALRQAGYATIEAESGEEALQLARQERPSVVILEVSLPGVCGYEVCCELRDAYGEGFSIVFLSGVRRESFDRVAGLLLGADDYLVKPVVGDELVARVRRLIHHHRGLTSGNDSRLTRREQEVLRLLAQGLDQKEIAGRLFISPRTVGTHIEHILAKLGVRSRTQAVALAYRDNLVKTAT